MRYWRPGADETAAAVKAWSPEQILLLPLYPQFSGTTTGSSLADWRRAARAAGLDAPERAICCYPELAGLVSAITTQIRDHLRAWRSREKKRILFSAHGLPQRIVERGDPYPWQIERTVAAITAALASELAEAGIETALCYQSRVGPLKWIGPSIDDEIRRAGADGTGVLVVPVAFVSEHSETLIELDADFKHLAGQVGVPTYLRAPTVSLADTFIAGLGELARQGFERASGTCNGAGHRICPASLAGCACATP
jgi:ferrochelatase